MSDNKFSIELLGSGFYRHDGDDLDPGKNPILEELMGRLGDPALYDFDGDFCAKISEAVSTLEHGDCVTIEAPFALIPDDDLVEQTLEITKGGSISFVGKVAGAESEYIVDFEDGARNIVKMLEIMEGKPANLKTYIGADSDVLSDERFEENLEELASMEIDELMHSDRKAVFLDTLTGKIHHPYEKRNVLKLIEPIEGGSVYGVVMNKVVPNKTFGDPTSPGI